MPRFALVLIAALSTAGIWAAEPLVFPRQSGWVGAVAFSPDGERLVIGTGDGSVTVWDLQSKKRVYDLQRHDDAVAALAFSRDGSMLVSGGHDRTAHVHQFDAAGTPSAKPLMLGGHGGAVLSAAFSPDDRQLFTGGIDGVIHQWALDSGKTLKQFRHHRSWVNGLAIDKSGEMLASASSDNSLRLTPLADGGKSSVFEVKEGEIRSVAFSPDGKRVAAGIRYGWVRVWDIDEKHEVFSTKAHAGETWAVRFTPDGKTLVSAGGDWNQPGEVRRWNAADWKEQPKLMHSGEVISLAISPDGRRLAAGSWDRSVRVWKVDSERE